jgi:hypothetical protein
MAAPGACALFTAITTLKRRAADGDRDTSAFMRLTPAATAKGGRAIAQMTFADDA